MDHFQLMYLSFLNFLLRSLSLVIEPFCWSKTNNSMTTTSFFFSETELTHFQRKIDNSEKEEEKNKIFFPRTRWTEGKYAWKITCYFMPSNRRFVWQMDIYFTATTKEKILLPVVNRNSKKINDELTWLIEKRIIK